MQQPPLSQQIHALERELGAQLFRRQPRGIELTEAGRALLADARAILAHVEHAFAATRRTARGEQGRIASASPARRRSIPSCRASSARSAKRTRWCRSRCEEGGSAELIDGLRSERLDAVFIRTRGADPAGLAVEPLLEEAMVAALPEATSRCARRGRAALAARGARQRDVHRLPAGQRPGSLRRDHRGLPRGRVHAARRAGGAAHRLDAQLRGRGARRLDRSRQSLARMHMDGVVFRRIRGAAAPRAVLNLASRRGEASPAVQRFLDAAKRAAAKRRENRSGP